MYKGREIRVSAKIIVISLLSVVAMMYGRKIIDIVRMITYKLKESQEVFRCCKRCVDKICDGTVSKEGL